MSVYMYACMFIRLLGSSGLTLNVYAYECMHAYLHDCLDMKSHSAVARMDAAEKQIIQATYTSMHTCIYIYADIPWYRQSVIVIFITLQNQSAPSQMTMPFKNDCNSEANDTDSTYPPLYRHTYEIYMHVCIHTVLTSTLAAAATASMKSFCFDGVNSALDRGREAENVT